MKNDMEAAFKERLANPFFGYFIFNLIYLNWKEIFYLFASDKTALERIEYFNSHSGLTSLFFGPLLLSAIIIFAKPYLAWLVKDFTTYANLKSKQVDIKHEIEIEKLKVEQNDIAEKAIIEKGKRDQELLASIENSEIQSRVQDELLLERNKASKKHFDENIERNPEMGLKHNLSVSVSKAVARLDNELKQYKNKLKNMEATGAPALEKNALLEDISRMEKAIGGLTYIPDAQEKLESRTVEFINLLVGQMRYGEKLFNLDGIEDLQIYGKFSDHEINFILEQFKMCDIGEFSKNGYMEIDIPAAEQYVQTIKNKHVR